MRRPCLGCGRLIPKGSRCRRCERTGPRRTPGRGSGWDATKFRREVLRLAGYRCQRCGLDQRQLAKLGRRLEAHHRRPLRLGGTDDPTTNGMACCSTCHPEAERESRERWGSLTS